MKKETDKKVWFKRKKYGWGWVPSSREGWYVTGGYVTVFVIAEIIFMNYMATFPSKTAIAIYGIFVVIITTLLIWVCYKKGESPKWTWGEDK